MGASARARPHTARTGRRLHVDLAAGHEDIRESQALRYRVFSQELGAQLPSAGLGLDVDRYDAHCEHLLVRELESGRVVASTRLLSDERAARAGGFYSEGELDLSNIKALSAQGFRLLMLLRLEDLDPAYERHFLGRIGRS